MKNIFVFFGNEELIIHNKIEKIVSDITTTPLNSTVYDMSIENIKVAIQDAMTPPFLANKKVIILKNPLFLTKEKTSIKHDIDSLMRYLDNVVETTYLIFDATKLEIDQSNEIVKKLKKVSEFSETRSLSDIEMRGWLKRKFDVSGKIIDNVTIDAFLNRIGWNLLSANNEYEKLINYVSERKQVTLDDVNKVVVKELETDVFSLINAIMAKNSDKIINSYQELVKMGNDPLKLLGLVSKNFRDLYIVKCMQESDAKQIEIASVLNVSANRAYYIIKNAKAFKKDTIEDIIINLGEIDYKIKTGQLEKTTGFEMFLFGV